MILTGSEIRKEMDNGNIVITPFDPACVNPNSYNYRLGSKLKIFHGIKDDRVQFDEVIIGDEGYVLEPRCMYLGHTSEIIGSRKYAMSLIGRSSIGRLGLFLQVSANLGHTGSSHNWTLELVATKRIKVYPGMKIGQVSFWENQGTINLYNGYYNRFNEPTSSRS